MTEVQGVNQDKYDKQSFDEDDEYGTRWEINQLIKQFPPKKKMRIQPVKTNEKEKHCKGNMDEVIATYTFEEESQPSVETLPHQVDNHQYHQNTISKYFLQYDDDQGEKQPNLPIGSLIQQQHRSKDTFRVYLQNIRGTKVCTQGWLNWEAGIIKTMQWNISMSGCTETNTDWNLKNSQSALRICRKHHKQAAVATSSNDEILNSNYQPGGTISGLFGKWTGRLTTRITDISGMGRWSGFRLRCKGNKHISIITAYRTTKDQGGLTTSYQQQWRHLRNQGITDPDPRKQFLDDITIELQKIQQQQDEIILMWDANESIGENKSALPEFLIKNRLCNLLGQHNSPSTYDRGTKCIDFIFGTNNTQSSVLAWGYLPFYDGAWEISDHRGLFVDFNGEQLFGTQTGSITETVPRALTSKSKPIIIKFLNKLEKIDILEELYLLLKALESNQEWSQQELLILESVDTRFTEALLKAEKECNRPSNAPWNPELHMAYLRCSYWQKKITGLKNGITVTEQLLEIYSKLEGDIYINNCTDGPTKQLKLARDQLRVERTEAQHKRPRYLSVQQEVLMENNNKRQANILQQILRYENEQRIFRMFRSVTKANQSSGGVSHLLKKDGEILIRIQDRDMMDKELLQRNQKHFAQAQGTPCTIPPLSVMLGHDGVTAFGKAILNGDVTLEIPEAVRAILHELRAVRAPLPHFYPIEAMMQGLSNWKESTTTSPSGKHLGIYKSLVVACKERLFTTTESKIREINGPNFNTVTTAERAMSIQHLLVNLAIRETYTFDRWKIVHNYMLEKIPGTPLLDKLRVIHIYEADWNLLLRYFIANQLKQKMMQEQTGTTEQAGGRPGGSSIDVAIKSVLTYETGRLQRTTGGVMYNDAKACYDRIVENIGNLALMREGLNPKICKLHAQTMREIKYYVRHRFGIGTTPNKHMAPNPVHGNGQGAADSGDKWGALSDAIIRAYCKNSSTAKRYGPISFIQITEKIKAFVDDTSIYIIVEDDDGRTIEEHIQRSTQWWEKLINASGGQLEITKCKFSLMKWDFDSEGRASLQTSNNIPIQIQDSESTNEFKVDQLNHSTAYKYLGCHIAIDGNMTTQIQELEKKCNQLATSFAQCPLDQESARIGFFRIFQPSARYVLPSTSISASKLEALQRRTINIILPKLGYNQHMARAIVFGPERFGGLGLQNLVTEQGAAKVIFVMGHIRSRSNLDTTLRVLLESYQIHAGMLTSALEDTSPHNYLRSPWVQTLREFLHQINGQIRIPSLQHLYPCRQYDSSIMSNLEATPPSDAILINACRLFLQVTSIGEIAHTNGEQLLPEAFYATLDKTTGNPTLWNISKSKVRWPQQTKPGKEAWCKWRAHLRRFTQSGNLKLRQKLGKWSTTCQMHRQWRYNFKEHYIREAQGTAPQLTTKMYQYNPAVNRRKRLYEKILTLKNHLKIINMIPIQPTVITTDVICFNTSQVQEIETRIKALLWHQHANPMTENVEEIYQKSRRIYVVADGNKSYEDLRFGGVIANESKILWKINGVAPPAILQHVTRAHAYSYYNLLMTIQQVIHQNPEAETVPIRILIQNKSIYQQLRRYDNHPLPYPNECTKKEHELVYSIHDLSQQMSNVELVYLPRTSEHCAGWLAKLYDYSSHLAETAKPGKKNQEIPLLPCNSATLIVNKVEIQANLMDNLRNAANTPDLRRYMEVKYKWTSATADKIDWHSHSQSIMRLPRPQRKFIQKFIHEWVPVNSHKSMGNPPQAQYCPHCKTEIETQSHMATCKHITVQHWWNDTVKKVDSYMNKTKTDQALRHLLIQGLEEWRETKHPPRPENLKNRHKTLFCAQNQIGWNHLLQGRFAIEWTVAYDKTNHSSLDGRTWVRRIIHILWTELHKLWKIRCNVQHGTDSESYKIQALVKLQPRIEQLFALKQQLDSTDQKIFTKTIEEVLALKITQMEQWVIIVAPFVKKGLHRAKKRSQIATKSITKYFPQKSVEKIPIKRKQKPAKWNKTIRILHQQNLRKAWKFKRRRVLSTTDTIDSQPEVLTNKKGNPAEFKPP